MSEMKAKMFNKKAARPANKADKIIQNLSIQQGQTIADIGSGGGFFTVRFAQAVGTAGKVYAVDTNQDLLDFIHKQASEHGLNNILTVQTTADQPNLPLHCFDIIFLRNVTHHLKERVGYFKKLKEALKPQGKIVIIDYDGRGTALSFQRLHHHFVPQETLKHEMTQAGYHLKTSYDFLADQSFNIFMINAE
jgi:arsenite methyltransferase